MAFGIMWPVGPCHVMHILMDLGCVQGLVQLGLCVEGLCLEHMDGPEHGLSVEQGAEASLLHSL
eukprot:scaffold61773_cov18-Tisochrysis_lutea.AAC.2